MVTSNKGLTLPVTGQLNFQPIKGIFVISPSFFFFFWFFFLVVGGRRLATGDVRKGLGEGRPHPIWRGPPSLAIGGWCAEFERWGLGEDSDGCGWPSLATGEGHWAHLGHWRGHPHQIWQGPTLAGGLEGWPAPAYLGEAVPRLWPVRVVLAWSGKGDPWLALCGHH